MVPPLPQPPDPHPPPPHHHPAPPYLHPRLLQPPFRRRSVAENVREEAASPRVLQDPPQGPPRRLLPAPPPPHPSTSGPLCLHRTACRGGRCQVDNACAHVIPVAHRGSA